MALQFKSSHLADRVAAILDTAGLAPDRLQIEVTEGGYYSRTRRPFAIPSQLGEDGEVYSIVRAIIDLTRAMRMTVTAEGVETQYQLRILRNMGCAELQRYLLSKPMSAEHFIGKARSRFSA